MLSFYLGEHISAGHMVGPGLPRAGQIPVDETVHRPSPDTDIRREPDYQPGLDAFLPSIL